MRSSYSNRRNSYLRSHPQYQLRYCWQLSVFILLYLVSAYSAANLAQNNSLLNTQSSLKTELNLTQEERVFLANHSHIRVHNEQDWAPYNYNEEGEAKGYSIDFMKLLAAKIGLTVHFVHGPTWDEFLTDIKNKQLDVMLNIINTEDRRKYISFTQHYLEPFSAIYGQVQNFQAINTLDDLKGKRLALPKGFYTEELIKRYYPDIDIHLTENIQQAIEAVRDNKADFTIGEDAVVQYHITLNKIQGVKAMAAIKDQRFANKLSIGVRDDWPILRKILQKAINSVTDQEIIRLRNRWFGTGSNTIRLTPAEKEFLKKNQRIRVHNEQDWPPFNFNEDDVAKGHSIDYIKLLANKVGLNIEFVSGHSWNTYLQMIENKEIDVMLNIKDTPSRRSFLKFTKPYFNSLAGIFSKPHQGTNSIEDLVGKRLAIVEGFYYQELLTEQYPNIDLYMTDSVSSSMEAVLLNKADALLADFNVANFLLQEQGISSIQSLGLLKDKRFASPLSMGVRDDWPELRSILEKASESLTEDERNAIKLKWLKFEDRPSQTKTESSLALNLSEKLYLNNHPTINVCYRSDWQPIEFFDTKQHAASGVSIDTLNKLNELTNGRLKLNYVHTQSLQESILKFRQGACDVLPAISKTQSLENEALFTTPYKHFKPVVITKSESPYINSLDQLEHRKLALTIGDSLNTHVKNEYEFLQLIETTSTVDALNMVSAGEAFATLAILPVASHYFTELGLSTLKIAGYSDIDIPLSIAVSKQNQELFQILNKGLNTLTKKDHQDIFQKHVSINIEPKADYTLLLQVLGAVLILFAFLIYRHLQVSRYNKILEALSVTDQLTQIYNRSKLDSELEKQSLIYERYQDKFCVIFCDIDYFKKINDSFGHQVGDKFLIEFANQLLKHSRKTDIVGRWGGEEFMVICPRTGLEGAVKLAMKLKQNIARHHFEIVGNRTSSFGVAEFNPKENLFSLVNHADKALYQAKEKGRNTVYYESDGVFHAKQ